MPQCKFSLYLKKAGLASRNIVHFFKKSFYVVSVFALIIIILILSCFYVASVLAENRKNYFESKPIFIVLMHIISDKNKFSSFYKPTIFFLQNFQQVLIGGQIPRKSRKQLSDAAVCKKILKQQQQLICIFMYKDGITR